jgi:hypothetical protein
MPAGASGSITVEMNGSLTGKTLAGRPPDSATLAPGADAHVAIRPEDIQVTVEGRTPADHALPGVIAALLFVGDRYEARVTVGDEHSILLLLPRAADWREGQQVLLAFPPETVSVWPA